MAEKQTMVTYTRDEEVKSVTLPYLDVNMLHPKEIWNILFQNLPFDVASISYFSPTEEGYKMEISNEEDTLCPSEAKQTIYIKVSHTSRKNSEVTSEWSMREDKSLWEKKKMDGLGTVLLVEESYYDESVNRIEHQKKELEQWKELFYLLKKDHELDENFQTEEWIVKANAMGIDSK